MRGKELVFLAAFLIVLLVSLGSYKIFSPSEIASTTTKTNNDKEIVVIPQLEEEGRQKSATMVLLGAPPTQPADHINRWNPDQHQESCMMCHNNPDTGAPTPPVNHYYNEDIKDKVFRDNCQQCHATQNDSKAAFNSKE